MRHVGRPLLLLLITGGWLFGPASIRAQAPVADLSADSVQLGEVFDLRVRLRVPDGSVVSFPDTVSSSDVLESFAPVAWSAEAVDGGASLTLTYPVIVFRPGEIPVPGLDVYVAPARAGASGASLPGGSLVLDADSRPAGPSASRFVTRIPRREVWVEPVFTFEDFERGVMPMPADDVVGGDWHWSSVAFVLLFTSVLGGAVLTTTREWLGGRPDTRAGAREVSLTAAQARQKALEELDALMTSGLRSGRERDFYGTSSAIVRTYVSRLDPSRGMDLTSSELMERLDEAGLAGSNRGLAPEMLSAEVVKFGRARPGSADAARHVSALREWVAESRATDA